MKTLDKELHTVPVYAISYLVNGDPSGLEAYEIEMIDKWYASTIQKYADEIGATVAIDASGDFVSFSPFPAFGMPCDCTDPVFIFLGD